MLITSLFWVNKKRKTKPSISVKETLKKNKLLWVPLQLMNSLTG